ncbi:MAG: DUF2851 family protein [Bacteroidota bacterium]
MTEQFLHYLWKFSVLPFHHLKLSDGEDFTIVKNGEYNQFESGPDFFNARIKINGILWCGPIEIHVKSSDWVKHGHQHDAAYNNVILHVVYENDIQIIQNGRRLPTIELKNLVPKDLMNRYNQLLSEKSNILCSKRIADIPPIYFQEMITKASVDRLELKVQEIDSIITLGQHQVLYTTLAKAFGSKVNALAFEQLSYRIPFHILKKIHCASRSKVLLHTSGLLTLDGSPDPNSTVFLLEPLEPQIWKQKGLRPHSFPVPRIRQFAELLNLIDLDTLLKVRNTSELYEFTKDIFSQFNAKVESSIERLSLNFQTNLLINCFLPLFIWRCRQSKSDFSMESAVDFLSLLLPESNYILSKWQAADVKPSNAFESQGLIELHNNYCQRKQCLSCSIGIKLMKE